MGFFRKFRKIIFTIFSIIYIVSRFHSVFATSVDTSKVVIVSNNSENYLRLHTIRQDALALILLPEVRLKTDFYNDYLRDFIYNCYMHNLFITNANYYGNTVDFNIIVYDANRDRTEVTSSDSLSGIFYANSTIDNVNYYRFDNCTQYVIHFDTVTRIGKITSASNFNTYIPADAVRFISDSLREVFVESILEQGGVSTDYNSVLSSINNNLNSITSVDSDMLAELKGLTSSLNNVANTSSSNSANISAINNKVSQILDDNKEIISQNDEMISLQEGINNNIEATNDKLDDLKDTLTDDSIESSASDLPSISVNDPTESGVSNIFQSIYNAFCTGNAQDIVFPIPFTNKNITLSPYYVSDMLNNNGASWVYTLIQVFWGYLIGRFIVGDITKKIDKIKGGDIENLENSNIKEEML